MASRSRRRAFLVAVGISAAGLFVLGLFLAVGAWQRTRPTMLEVLYGVPCMAFSPRGDVLAVGVGDAVRVDLLSVRDGTTLDSLRGDAETGGVCSVAFDSSGRLLIFGDTYDQVHLWSLDERRELAVLGSRDSGFCVESACFARDGRHVAALSVKGAHLWRLEDRSEVTLQCTNLSTGSSLAFLSDGNVGVVDWANWAAVFDTSGHELVNLRAKACRICSGKDAFVDEDREEPFLRVRSILDGHVLARVPRQEDPYRVSESSDLSMLAVGHSRVELRREADGSLVRRLPGPSGGYCSAMAFSPGATSLLALAWSNGEVHVFRCDAWPYR